jgi:MFS transporter, SP family, xylose:H+ symportor
VSCRMRLFGAREEAPRLIPQIVAISPLAPIMTVSDRPAPPESSQKYPLLLYRAAAIAALGGFLFGFDTAVISGAEQALQRAFHLSPFWLGFTVASALIGTIIGSMAIEKPADTWGRKKTLILLAVLYFVSSIGCAVAPSWLTLLVFRLIGGLAIGGASVVTPMYIAEISPIHLRGRLVALNQLNIVLGILVSFLSNYLISRLHVGPDSWRWMLGMVAVPATLFFALLFTIVERPRWLVKAGLPIEAEFILRQLGTHAPAQVVTDIRTSLAGDGTQERLFQRRYLRPIFLAWAIAMFNQLSGINALMYYAPRIFESTGSTEGAALLQTVALGSTNLVFTIIGMSLIDWVGRRQLIIWGSYGYLASLLTIAWAFGHYGKNFDSVGGVVAVVSLLIFQASHAMSQGAVIWVFISEIFPNAVRAKGQALGSATHWCMAALISWTFPSIAAWSSGSAFAFFAVMMGLQLMFAWKIMPETRSVSLESTGF